MKANIFDAIFDDIAHGENYSLVTDCGERITYTSLHSIVRDVGDYLHGERLALLVMKNDLGSVVFYLACLQMHVVPIILEGSISGSQLQLYIEQYEPEYIFIPGESETTFSVVRERHYEILTEVFGHVLLERVYRMERKIHADLAILMPTSGTVYISKLVRISNTNLYDNAKNICEGLAIDKEDVAITSLPLSYCYGLSVLNTHLLKHATILLTDKSVLQKGFWDFANSCKATSLAGVPYTYELLNQRQHMSRDSSIKVYTQAGGRLSTKIKKEFIDHCAKLGKKFYVMYGMTEATARISILPVEYARSNIESVGFPIKGGQITIEKEKDSDKEGEIVYAGKNVCMGYCVDQEDLSLGDINHGILHTGDYGYLDKDGLLHITGRKGDFIKLYGRRLCLNSISRLVEKLCGTEVICKYVNGKICIIYERGSHKDMQTIMEKLHIHLHIKREDLMYRMIDRFPRTYNGKISLKKGRGYCDEV